ncbi:ribonuclease III [Fructobacillus sp. M1-13]|uniref:Ribonuclease 3 n=1 Tax=Fructobacillus papyriferae TaxID=2713171 RepID=A0ABS5QPP1_9LACO|nr:ribonuclease III [Fructobacillus papyriferae]MBS9334867.1 ribonuclease III [Fructobacillus papyriferae]MCD2158857.1 ribonuclease III [Fructobacillus papyriferae]
MSPKEFTDYLAKNFQINFSDLDLLKEALTQRNFLNENPKETGRDYQRLEFLGDAIMQASVTEYLFKRYPEWDEGQLTEMRITMVQTKSFAHFAKVIHLNEAIRLGKGEEMSGARERPSLLEDIWEAFIGALFLDQGQKAVDSLLMQTVFSAIDENFFDQFIDFKSRLQEKLQAKGAVDIDYTIEGEERNEDNTQVFKVSVSLDDHILAYGYGSSIKDAEKAAAQQALVDLTE